MKEINGDEQKKVLLGILDYINTVAKKNGIHYTLIGGSLIGAVREGGIIPWDDDIDIGLLPDEYEKLIQAIKSDDNRRYIVLDSKSEPSYYYPFAKIVDTETTGYEIEHKTINQYGVYIDVFKYNIVPDEEKKISKYYKKREKMVKKLFRSIDISNKTPIKGIYHRVMSHGDSVKISKKIEKYSEKYNDGSYRHYCMISWTPYGAARETHNVASFSSYRSIMFDGIETMIIDDYDSVLKRTFGDYMTPPPKSKQVTHHNMKMYWK